MKNRAFIFSLLFIVCLMFTGCGGNVVSPDEISNISQSDLEGIEYLSVYQVLPCSDGRYCIDVYTSQDENSDSYILPLADEFYGETQTFGVVGARSVTQYFDAKEFYEDWWKAGTKNNEFVYNTRFSYRLNDAGEITYLSEFDYYADTDVTGIGANSDDNNIDGDNDMSFDEDYDDTDVDTDMEEDVEG